MKRIHITPSWSFHDDNGQSLNPQLFQLLSAIHTHGRLTQAATSINLSYRHCWNLLQQWSAFFGQDLVIKQKGRGSSLSPLGEKLLWAEQRVVARLQPQLESLASELTSQIHQAMQDVTPALRLHASYGYAVALLPEHCSDIQLDLQYRSAEQALAAVATGRCDIAGFHMPTMGLGQTLQPRYRQYFKPRVHRIIRFITRQQGLMVSKNNPLNIAGLRDLSSANIRFINRQRDSGTRALLDELLTREGISSEGINGYDNEEFTHSAVAAYIAAGMADVGIGVQAAAQQFGLDFLPLCEENYLFLCHQKLLEQEATQRFIQHLRQAEFHAAVAKLPGYEAIKSGEIQTVETLFP